MGTAEKLKVAKEILAQVFIDATTSSAESGLMFKYKSQPVETEEFKGWTFDIIVKEPAYPERTIQQFRYQRPNNIDAKNMEYHVVIAVLAQMTQSAILTWDHLGKLLNTDEKLQKEALETTKEK